MLAENEGSKPADRLSDGGPRYTETPADPLAADAPPIAEPWNAVTASFFIVIVAYWVWRLRGRYGKYPFLCCCLPILLAGGIGGTLYHAQRSTRIYFLLDIIPIIVLALVGSIYMALRYWGSRGWWFIPAVGAFYLAMNRLIFASVGSANIQLRINLSYASLAVVILAPIVLVLWRTHFRNAQWVVAGLISFIIAWFFRLWDQEAGPYLEVGSHWLWHTFGAIATALIIEYFYRVESEAGVAVNSVTLTGKRLDSH